jgi:class 3 adenylate cyclase
MGLHTGEMVRDGDDFFGRHVNLAARVSGVASRASPSPLTTRANAR